MSADDGGQGEQQLTDYELQRQQLIARNRARLIALGIPDAVAGLAALAPKPQAPRAPKRRRHEAPQEPQRHSARVRNMEMEARGEVPPDVDPGSELGRFIINGECPKCGRVIEAGHRRHLESCKGLPPPPPPPTEEEIAEQAEKMKSVEKAKLRQLELGGLVDFSDDEAVFIVIGSTGNHYVVRLSDDKRSCTCMDHRIRRRDCKHIKLILAQLGVANQPVGDYDWRGGVQHISKGLGSAAEEDVQMVHTADARRQAAAARRQKTGGEAAEGEAAAAAGGEAEKQAAGAASRGRRRKGTRAVKGEGKAAGAAASGASKRRGRGRG